MSDFRNPFETASWSLVPGHTVLVNIDLQNDFLHPDGWYARSDIDISHMRRVVEPVQELVAACRSRDIPVVWTRHGTHGVEDGGPFMELRPVLRDGGLRTGTWGYEIVAELQPQAEDRFVEKNRLSAFFRRPHQPVRRGDLQGRALPGLQTDRRRGGDRDDAAPPPRAGDRDDPGRLGSGEHPRADARRAGGVPVRPRRSLRGARCPIQRYLPASGPRSRGALPCPQSHP